MKKEVKRGLFIVFAVVVVILLISLIFYTFFYTKKVSTQQEFNQNLFNCDRASYMSDQTSAVWGYRILGAKDGNCLVDVTLVTAKEGVVEIKNLEGKDMICSLPLGSINNPEADLKFCHGLLKEDMQTLLIEKMHAYVTSNLGDIAKSL